MHGGTCHPEVGRCLQEWSCVRILARTAGLGFREKTAHSTLPETNMETQKGPYKDYSPFKGGLYGFPC